MGAGDLVRFCNNPACERCDEHLRPRDVLRKSGREVCPTCHEELILREPRPRPPLSIARRPPRRA
jgi:hypothetical protein